MRSLRAIAGWSGTVLLSTALSVPLGGTAVAVADPVGEETDRSRGRGAATTATAPSVPRAEVIRRAAAAAVSGDPLVMPTSYPSQPRLRFYRDNPDDAAETPNLLTHPDLAPLLTEWMAESDRISVQVVGQSTGGRDLYLVTVTAPETEEETAQQTAWREKIRLDPAAAAADTALLAQYKTPIWFSNNIHGNEWEGTDAAMDTIDRLVHAPLSQVGSILRNNRLYFSLSLNPDGRTAATRATALGLDPNRDLITNTTPETRSFVRTAQALQPIYSADFHGYTGVLQVEPTGPPHGSNYEYDLYLPYNYELALDVEADVVAAAIPGNTYFNTATGTVSATNTGPDTAHIKIPYRDTPSGWDDFPPIFTAQYAAFFGAASSTVELPLSRTAPGGRMTPERAAVNKAVALQTYTSMIDYLTNPAKARAMVQNQIEVFRRGVAGEPKASLTGATIAAVPGPAQWKPLWDVADDQEPVNLPRAYVIPVGDGQRSESDAARLVEQLLFHNIEVGRLTAPATVGGVTYPAGSHVVDLHQPLRGLANSLLDLGDDISAKVPTMYDISAWSYSYLWGATVAKVGSTTDEPIGPTVPVTGVERPTEVPTSGYPTLELAGLDDVRALNALLEDGVPASLLEDGVVVMPPSSRGAVADVVEEIGVSIGTASEEQIAALADPDTRGLQDLTIAYTGSQDDRLSLTELGFDDLVSVSTTTITAAITAGDTSGGLADADVLWLGANLSFNAGTPGRAALQAFVDSGRSIVGRGASAFTVASTYGLLSGTAVSGNGSGNGIVDVDTTAGGVLAPFGLDTSFVYPAVWFTGLGEGVTVEQSYGADPLLAGHWRRGTSQGQPVSNGPEDAAGKPAVVSAEAASGARAFVFGTSVFYRTHVKAGATQAARALFWAAPEGTGVAGPSQATVALSAPAEVTYPATVPFEVTVDLPQDATAAGEVVIVDAADEEVARGDLVDGAVTLTGDLLPGAGTYTATFVPDDASVLPAASAPVAVTVRKASSGATLALTKQFGRTVVLTVDVDALTERARTVRLLDRGQVVRTITLVGSTTTRRVALKLAPGGHRLRAVVAANAVSDGTRSDVVVVRIR